MYCWKCGNQLAEGAVSCESCGTKFSPVYEPKSIEEDPFMRSVMPIGRSGWAIAAGYLGLFSVLPGFGVFSILCSALAFRDIKRNPKKIGKGRAIFGMIMGILGTVVWTCIFVQGR